MANVIKGIIDIEAPGAGKEIKILIEGLDRLEAAIERLSTVLDKFSGDLSKVTVNTQRFGKGISTIPRSLNAAGSAANKSKTDFTNLGRVIQDLPFGFIAIQNNLTQLVSGAGLLGLALSSLVAILTFNKVGLTNWGIKSEEAKKAAEDAARAQEEMKRAFEAAAAAVVNQADKLKDLRTLLVSTAQDVNTLTDSIIKQALAQFLFSSKEKVVQEAITKTIEDRFKVERSLAEFRTKEFKQEDFRRKRALPVTPEADLKKGQAVIEFEVPLARQFREASVASKEFFSQNKAEINIINDIAQRLGLNFAQFVDKVKKGKDPLDELIDRAKKLAAYLNENTIRSAVFEIDPETTKAQQAKQAQEFLDKILDPITGSRRNLDIKINANVILEKVSIANAQKLGDAIEKEALKSAEELRKAVEAASEKNPIRFKIQLERAEAEKNAREFFGALGLGALAKQEESTLTDVQKQIINTASLVDSTLTPAFESFFDALLSGDNPIKGFFDGVVGAIGSVIKELGVAILKALLLKAIFSAFGFGGTASIGDIFKGLLGFRAEGGPVTAGGSYIVGERGPELFTPNTGGRIVSNADMNRGGMGSFQAQPVQVGGQVRISGNDLILVLANAGRSQNRLS